MNLLGIMPELAYARGRKLIPNKFYRIMKACLRNQSLVTVGDFRLFLEFLTAVLAYHKFREKSNQES
jgi:CRISPR type III-A-associated protein Csm2